MLHALPRRAVVLDHAKQVCAGGLNATGSLNKAFEVKTQCVNAAQKVRKAGAQPLEQDALPQFLSLGGDRSHGSHEHSGGALTKNLDTELAVPPGEALRRCDLRQVQLDLQVGHVLQ
jgi:hypothetical protein